MFETSISNGSHAQDIGLRDLTSALIVTGSVLLVVDHWRHFDTTDLVLLGLVTAAIAADLLTWASVQRKSRTN